MSSLLSPRGISRNTFLALMVSGDACAVPRRVTDPLSETSPPLTWPRSAAAATLSAVTSSRPVHPASETRPSGRMRLASVSRSSPRTAGCRSVRAIRMSNAARPSPRPGSRMSTSPRDIAPLTRRSLRVRGAKSDRSGGSQRARRQRPVELFDVYPPFLEPQPGWRLLSYRKLPCRDGQRGRDDCSIHRVGCECGRAQVQRQAYFSRDTSRARRATVPRAQELSPRGTSPARTHRRQSTRDRRHRECSRLPRADLRCSVGLGTPAASTRTSSTRPSRFTAMPSAGVSRVAPHDPAARTDSPPSLSCTGSRASRLPSRLRRAG